MCVRPAESGGVSKVVDAWIRDGLASVNQICLAECKWWDTDVPQEMVSTP